jgi:hypothetical protein
MSRIDQYGFVGRSGIAQHPAMCPRDAERDRQKEAIETLLGTSLPGYVRVTLRAFHQEFEPAISEGIQR